MFQSEARENIKLPTDLTAETGQSDQSHKTDNVQPDETHLRKTEGSKLAPSEPPVSPSQSIIGIEAVQEEIDNTAKRIIEEKLSHWPEGKQLQHVEAW